MNCYDCFFFQSVGIRDFHFFRCFVRESMSLGDYYADRLTGIFDVTLDKELR